jgi:ketosteroid isomerase-like protein
LHPNEKVLRDADEAQARGDQEGFMAAYTDDAVIHIPGKSSFAGDYKGRISSWSSSGVSWNARPSTFESHAYLADDKHGVILQRSHYKRGDETLDSNDTFVCHFRDGKVSGSGSSAKTATPSTRSSARRDRFG